MSSAFTDIAAALTSNLKTLATANSIAVAWENKEYKPVIGINYLRPTHLPADTEGVGLADNSSDRHDGIYQVDVFTPSDKGAVLSAQLADDIAGQFKRGTTLTQNGVDVRIKTVSVGTGRPDGAWFIKPVFITYYSYTTSR